MRITFRHNKPEDHAFVYATYIRNRWFDKANTTTLKRSTWSALQHNRLEGILNEQRVIVACLDEDSDTICGYAFIDDNSPYVYIKLAFRSDGFGLEAKLKNQLTNQLIKDGDKHGY